MPIQCGMLTGSLTLTIKTTVQACRTLLRASRAAGPCPQEFSVLCSHYSREDSKAWAGCVCVHINAKDFCNRRRWEKMFLPQEHLGCLHFSFLLHSATFSVAHVSLSGNSAKGKKETKSTAWDQASIPATGQGQMPGYLWGGSAKLLKSKVQNRGQEALAGRRHGSFSEVV